MSEWVNPILLEPWFAVAGPEPIRIPLAAAAPASLLDAYRLPPLIGSGFRAYVAADGEGAPALVLHQGPVEYEHAEQDGGPCEHLVQVLAPYLPDLRLIVHPQEEVRSTLTAETITEIVVERRRVRVRRWPIGELVPRFRWSGLERGHQVLAFEREILLALAARPGASEALLAEVRAEVPYMFGIVLEQFGRLGRFSLYDVPTCLRWAHQLGVLGYGGAHLTGLCERLRAAAAPLERELLAELTASRGATRPAPARELNAIERELCVGELGELRRVLGAVGPGALGAGAELFAVGGEQGLVAATMRARLSARWPPEVVVIGAIEGARLCLDTRFQPSPVLREPAEPGRELIEEDAGLFAFLTSRLGRGGAGALDAAHRAEDSPAGEPPASPDPGRAQEEALIARLRERPYDDELRLVYADYLEERGEPARALFLRAHVGRVRGVALPPDLDARVAEVDLAWRRAVHPHAARRHPAWLAAALGDPEARAALGASAPAPLAEGALDFPRSELVGYEPFEGWPRAVLARLAIAAAGRAVAAVARRTDPEVARALELLERIAELADGPAVEAHAHAPLLGAARALVRDRAASSHAQVTARWHAFTAVRCAARTIGSYRASGLHDRGVPAATAHALGHGIDAVRDLAWVQGDARRLHQKADQLERMARAAGARAERWADSPRGPVARAALEGWRPGTRLAQLEASARRSRDLATECARIARAARAACPPPPDEDAVARATLAAISATVLAWLREAPRESLERD